MNQKQFGILVALVVVLGAAGWVVRQRSQSSWQSAGTTIGQKLLGDFSVNDVASMRIRSGGGSLTVAVKDGKWKVAERADYPANFSAISDLLLKLADLKAVQSEPVGPSQYSRYQLLPPGASTNAGTLVEFFGKDGKPVKILLVGKPHMRKSAGRPSMGGEPEDAGWPDGRYVMVGTNGPSVALVSDQLSAIDPKVEPWLDKDFIKIEKIKSITVDGATNSWKLVRETEGGDWKMPDIKPDEKLDTSKTTSLNFSFNSLSFTDVMSASQPVAAVSKPVVATFETFEGFTYTLKVATTSNDTHHLSMTVKADLTSGRIAAKDEKPEDKAAKDKEFQDQQKRLQDKLAQEKACEGWQYEVSSMTVEPLLKDRSQWLAEKKTEPAASSESTNAAPILLPPPNP